MGQIQVPPHVHLIQPFLNVGRIVDFDRDSSLKILLALRRLGPQLGIVQLVGYLLLNLELNLLLDELGRLLLIFVGGALFPLVLKELVN